MEGGGQQVKEELEPGHGGGEVPAALPVQQIIQGEALADRRGQLRQPLSVLGEEGRRQLRPQLHCPHHRRGGDIRPVLCLDLGQDRLNLGQIPLHQPDRLPQTTLHLGEQPPGLLRCSLIRLRRAEHGSGGRFQRLPHVGSLLPGQVSDGLCHLGGEVSLQLPLPRSPATELDRHEKLPGLKLLPIPLPHQHCSGFVCPLQQGQSLGPMDSGQDLICLRDAVEGGDHQDGGTEVSGLIVLPGCQVVPDRLDRLFVVLVSHGRLDEGKAAVQPHKHALPAVLPGHLKPLLQLRQLVFCGNLDGTAADGATCEPAILCIHLLPEGLHGPTDIGDPFASSAAGLHTLHQAYEIVRPRLQLLLQDLHVALSLPAHELRMLGVVAVAVVVKFDIQ